MRLHRNTVLESGKNAGDQRKSASPVNDGGQQRGINELKKQDALLGILFFLTAAAYNPGMCLSAFAAIRRGYRSDR